jgi:predicted outer membrane repeat protein
MNTGSLIENITRTVVGGGVALAGSGSSEGTRSTLTINGGIIRNNRATNGGGVHLGTNSHVHMNDGRIEGNISTSTSSGAGGGGVFLNASTSVFNMMGGAITGNRAETGTRTNAGGGGVRINNGAFNMTGPNARIENNTATGTSVTSGGGGIFQSGGVVTMTAGIIDNNTAANQGGGVRVSTSSAGAFRAIGGTISNNHATGDGGGIFTTQHNNALTLPATAYRNLTIEAPVRFLGNTSGRGASAPPNNRLAHIASATTSIWDYVLNNLDINYTGRLGQVAAVSVETADDITVTTEYGDYTEDVTETVTQ